MVKDLIKKLEEMPKDAHLAYQLVGSASDSRYAWNMGCDVVKVNDTLVVLTMSHPQLQYLPDIDNEKGVMQPKLAINTYRNEQGKRVMEITFNDESAFEELTRGK